MSPRRRKTFSCAIDVARSSDLMLDIVEDLVDTTDDLLRKRRFSKIMGLSAVQIGHPYRVFITRLPAGESTVFVNPSVDQMSEETDVQYEGCLSFFEFRGRVRRALRIKMSYLDLDGRRHEEKFKNATARIIQHEMDHLDGVLYTERMDAGEPLITYEQYRRQGKRGWSCADEAKVRGLSPDAV